MKVRKYKVNLKKMLVIALVVAFFVSALNISAFAMDGEQGTGAADSAANTELNVEPSASASAEPSASASAEPSASASAEPSASASAEPSASASAEPSASASAEPSAEQTKTQDVIQEEVPAAMSLLGRGGPLNRNYTVTYDSNGYFTAPSDSRTYAPGAKVTVLDGDKAAHDQSGKHTFLGWSTSKNDKIVNTSEQYRRLVASGRFYTGGETYIMGNGNVTFYAVFGSATPSPSELFYFRNDTEADAGVTVYYSKNGESLQTIGSGERIGFTKSEISGIMFFVRIDEGHTYQGISYTAGQQAEINVDIDKAPKSLGGYNFSNAIASAKAQGCFREFHYSAFWAAHQGEGGVRAFKVLTNEKPVELTSITYYANDTSGRSTGQSVVQNKAATLLGSGTFTRTGYTLAGWNTRADGKGVSYSLGGTYQVGTSAVKLYAVWQIQTYTVTFEAGEGGSLAQGMQTVFTDIKYNTPWNQAVTEPAPVPDEEYYFAGWTPSLPSAVTKTVVYTAQFAEKTEITLTANSDDSKTYNGSRQTVSGYSGVPEGLTVTGVEAQGSGTDAGTYTVAFTQKNAVVKDANGRDVTDQYKITYVTGTLAIGKAGLTITANDAYREYGKENPAFSFTQSGLKGTDTVEGVGLAVTLDCAAGAASPVGPYDIVPSGAAATKNYNVSYVNGTLTIGSSGTLGISAVPYQGTYDGAEHDGVVSVTPSVENAVITYSIDGENYSPGMPRFTNAGTYSVYVKAEAANYKAAVTQVTAVIGKADLTITANDAYREYGKENPAFSFTQSGLKGTDTVEGVGLAVTLDCAAGAASPVGPYDIVPSGAAATKNYNVSYANGTLTITYSTALTLDAEAYSGTYDGISHGGITKAAPSVENAAITYSIDGENYSPAMPQFTNAGDYPVYVRAEAPNYNPAVARVTVAVKKADLTVTAEDMAKVYGQENPQFTVSYSGLVNGESGAVLLGTLAFDCAADTLSPVDSYAVTPGGLTSDNYEISFAEGVLTVTPKPVTVTAENKTKTAGDADPALTAVVSGLVGSDTLQYTLGRDAGEAAGTYAIRVAPGSNPNYSVKTVDAVLTITAAPADPTPAAPTPPETPTTPTAPTAPETPAAPGTPAASGTTGGTPPAAEDTVTVPDNQTPLAGSEDGNNGDGGSAEQEPVTIDDNQTPLAGGIGQASWALLNLLLAIATGIIMIVLLAGYFIGRKKNEAEEGEGAQLHTARGEEGEEQGKLKRKGIVRLLSIIPAVAAIIAFILTENIWNPMVWTDKWTLLMAVIAVVQVVVAVFTKKSRKDKEDEEPEGGIRAERV
ncbi:MBG domain-containing protein [Christensenella minuta]|uniref:MBG domain-containing protein n=1 Tax=Christensenella minuta TaxID=626937 RepID=UPI002157977D|nr:MBG domain-containing protein [Christensenella minuta]